MVHLSKEQQMSWLFMLLVPFHAVFQAEVNGALQLPGLPTQEALHPITCAMLYASPILIKQSYFYLDL